MAFADGHVAFKAWQYPARTRSVPEVPVRNEPDRADLAWVVGGVPSVKLP